MRLLAHLTHTPHNFPHIFGNEYNEIPAYRPFTILNIFHIYSTQLSELLRCLARITMQISRERERSVAFGISIICSSGLLMSSYTLCTLLRADKSIKFQCAHIFKQLPKFFQLCFLLLFASIAERTIMFMAMTSRFPGEHFICGAQKYAIVVAVMNGMRIHSEHLTYT